MGNLRAGETQLRGVYLPYRLFQEPFSFTVRRAQGNERDFAGESFLSHKAVVTADNLPNDLLDHVEPFDWSGLQEFHFGYLAGLSAQVEKNGYDKTVDDLSREVHEDLDGYVKASLHTPQTRIAFDLEWVVSAPVLLPIYYVNLSAGRAALQAAVNGQTGRVAVYTGITEKKVPWYIEPVLLTVLFYLGMLGLILFNEAGKSETAPLFDLLGVPALFAAVFALPIFDFYNMQGEPVLLKRFFGTQEQKWRDAKTRRLVTDESAVASKDDVAYPVFMRNTKGHPSPSCMRSCRCGAWRMVEDAVPVTTRASGALGGIRQRGCAAVLFLLFMLGLLLLGRRLRWYTIYEVTRDFHASLGLSLLYTCRTGLQFLSYVRKLCYNKPQFFTK